MAANASVMMIGALLAAAFCFSCCAAVLHDLGTWTLGREQEYKEWAESTVFYVQDAIQFRYTAGVHNVWELGSLEEFQSCNIGDPMSTFNDGNAVVTLTTPGMHYFVCAVGLHCGGGMRVAINVSSAPPPAGLPFPIPDSPAPSPALASDDDSSDDYAPARSPTGFPFPIPIPDSPAPSPALASDYDSSHDYAPAQSPTGFQFPLPDSPVPAPALPGDYESSPAEDYPSPAASPSKNWSFDDEEQQYGDDTAAAPAPGGDWY